MKNILVMLNIFLLMVLVSLFIIPVNLVVKWFAVGAIITMSFILVMVYFINIKK